MLPLNSAAIIEYQIRHRGCNVFGQIRNDWIKLKAPVTSFTSMAPDIEDQATGMSSFTLFGVHGGENKASARFDFEEETPEHLQLVFILRTETSWGSGIEKQGKLSGLLIRGVQDLSSEICKEAILRIGTTQIYKRVGFFSMEETSYIGELSLGQLATEVVMI